MIDYAEGKRKSFERRKHLLVSEPVQLEFPEVAQMTEEIACRVSSVSRIDVTDGMTPTALFMAQARAESHQRHRKEYANWQIEEAFEGRR